MTRSLSDPDRGDTSIATLGTLDHRTVNWADVRTTGYLIHQHFRYEYTGPIRDLRQRLVIIPPECHGDQRLISHRLEVSSPTTEMRRETDRFGNLVLSLLVDQVGQAIDFVAWIVVERDRLAGPTVVTATDFAGPAFRSPSTFTQPDDALREAADQFRGQSDDPMDIAARINAWVHEQMRYAHGVTGVRTIAAEAFAVRTGVCQDYSHIMLTLCRLCGVPARYVSGHLLGEGGTHAWVEVLVPDPDHAGRFIAHAFDPTNGNEPGLNYVTVAIGRDYGDVAPTSGTYVAPYSGHLSAKKSTGLTAISYF